MKTRTSRGIGSLALLLGLALAGTLLIATAGGCTNPTAPRFPSDTAAQDTTHTALHIVTGPRFLT